MTKLKWIAVITLFAATVLIGAWEMSAFGTLSGRTIAPFGALVIICLAEIGREETEKTNAKDKSEPEQAFENGSVRFEIELKGNGWKGA